MEKKTIIVILIMAILLLAIPLTVKLVETQRQIISKATGNEIRFVTSDTLKCTGSGSTQRCTTTTPEVEIQLDSPFGSPMPTPTP